MTVPTALALTGAICLALAAAYGITADSPRLLETGERKRRASNAWGWLSLAVLFEVAAIWLAVLL